MLTMDTVTTRHLILEALRHAHPYAMAVHTLRTRLVTLGVRPTPIAEEVSDHLRALADLRHVSAERDQLDREIIRWRLTEHGRAWLAAQEDAAQED